MDPGAILARLLERPRVAEFRRVVDAYGQAPGGLLANGLAFSALFATVPAALVMLGVAGRLVDDPALQERLAKAIGDLLPPLRNLVERALETLSEGAALTSVIGAIGLVWTVSRFYVALDVAFSRIWSHVPERGSIRRILRGFLWVAGLIGLVVAIVVVGGLASLANSLLPDQESVIQAVGRVLSSAPVLIAVVVGAVMLAYWLLPPRTPPLSAVWLPGLAAGVVIAVLSQVFLYLAPRLISATAIAGSLATAFVALTWLSLTFQALLLGAAWVRVRAEARALTDQS